MNNTINLNYMTKTYNNFLKNYETNSSTERSFMNNVEEVSAAKAACGTGAVSTQEMTMEEYKQYIYDKISSLPMDPSHMQDNISIHISEAGFEAMKNDPEYEKWVLDWLEKDFMTYNPWTSVCGGHYCVKYIGASPEEYRGEGWYAGYQNGKGRSLYNEKSKDSFWERRIEREKRLREQYEESLEKKALAKKWREKMLKINIDNRQSDII